MYEVLSRCGMSRVGRLSLGETELVTPNVFFIRGKGWPTASYAGAFLAARRGARSLAVDGLPPGKPPPLLARPISMEEVAFPSQEEQGDIAFVSDPKAAAGTNTEVVALQNAVEYLRYPKRYAHSVQALREAAGYQRAIYAPLLATPSNLPILTYCGIDLVDILRVVYDGGRGLFHTTEGPEPIDRFEEWPCMCPSCARKDLLGHNLRALVSELRKVKAAIIAGTLRELVERRVSNDPWMTSVLREFDYRCYDWQELHFPVVGPPLKAYSRESLHRPDVVRYRRRLKERYHRPPSAPVLLLLPCSARKPYSTSRSHRLFRSILRACGNPWAVHPVVVTSPLGLVPLELELSYPAQHYDIPVTGDWSEDEAAVLKEDVQGFLSSNNYQTVVVHLGPEAKLLDSVMVDATVTSREKPRSPEALASLREALEKATSEVSIVPSWKRHAEDHQVRAAFQFGSGGEALVAGCTVRGRYPNLRLLREGTQVAALSGDRGMFSLTLEGGRILAERGLYWVEIDDFYPEGNVFAIGVLDAHDAVRVGDDVVVKHGDEVRAVGVARMNPSEMIGSDRGEAVHVRHKVSPAGA